MIKCYVSDLPEIICWESAVPRYALLYVHDAPSLYFPFPFPYLMPWLEH